MEWGYRISKKTRGEVRRANSYPMKVTPSRYNTQKQMILHINRKEPPPSSGSGCTSEVPYRGLFWGALKVEKKKRQLRLRAY